MNKKTNNECRFMIGKAVFLFLKRGDYHNLWDANHMQNAANNNEIFSIHFRDHADNGCLHESTDEK